MENISVSDMKKVLKGAKLYEEGMSLDEMREIYETILISENTATEEKENSDWWNSSTSSTSHEERSSKETSLRFRNITLQNIETKSTDSYRTKSKNKNQVLDATNAFVPFEDMPKSEKIPGLEIVEYPLKFVNIQNSQAFQESSTNKKAKMLYEYHTEMARQRCNLYRKSFFLAPLPKPIILKVSESDEFEEALSDNYFSRSGRHLKKRIYYKEEEDAFEYKKQKSQIEADLDWKLGSANKRQLKQDSKAKETTVSGLNSPKSQRKSSSSEIMGNSSGIFNDPISKPKTPLRKSETFIPKCYKDKFSQAEQLFDNFIQETQVKEREMNMQQTFEQTVELESSDDEVQSQEIENEVVNIDYEPLHRRVQPHLPNTRRDYRNKKLLTQEIIKKNKDPASETQTKIPKHAVELHKCPICLQNFSIISQLTEHAATCVNFETSAIQPKHVQSEAMMCDVCDKVITSNYSQHVSSCIQINKN